LEGQQEVVLTLLEYKVDVGAKDKVRNLMMITNFDDYDDNDCYE
jgi:hypothetical protein